MNKLTKLSSAVVFALLAQGAIAQTADTSSLPVPLQMAVSGGLKVEKSFKAAGGMTGWILSQGVGNNIVVYTTPDNSVAIAGNMLDATGANLTKKYLEEHAPAADYSKMWGELEKSTWVAEGPKNAKNYIYVFKDANCSFCHLAWKALQPYVNEGLQVRWIPVAFLAPDSVDKAAALLSAKDTNKAIADLHNGWGKKAAVPAASAELKAKVEANNKLMNGWGFRGTPATIYKDKEGKVQAINGMPSLSQLPAITGMKELPQTDPTLARFK